MVLLVYYAIDTITFFNSGFKNYKKFLTQTGSLYYIIYMVI